MILKRCFSLVVFAVSSFCLSTVVSAEPGPITKTHIVTKGHGGELTISWTALGQDWEVIATKVNYLGNTIPLINVESDTGDESLAASLPNCYYMGALSDSTDQYTTAYINLCPGSGADFSGFVSSGDNLYGMNGVTMSLLETGGTGNSGDDTGAGDNIKRTQGPSKNEPMLYARPGIASFPSLEIVIEPSYIEAVGAEGYIDRVMENLALANMIYERSLIKPMDLVAILVLDNDISTSDSQGNILSEVERLRKQNIQANSGDITMFLTGKEFSMPGLWGWSEGGYACDLQRAVAEGDNISAPSIAKSAGVMRDLPTLMQRGWILAHEVGHSLGAGHWANDPLMDGGFQPELSLRDYYTRCEVLRSMLETCVYDPRNKKFTDFYECS